MIKFVDFACPQLYLDCVNNGSVTTEQSNRGASQQWTISPATGGDYQIRSQVGVLHVNQQNQLVCNDTTGRGFTWTIELRGSNGYVIWNAVKDQAIQLPINGPVIVFTRNNETSQFWILEPDPVDLNTGDSLRSTGFPTGKFRIRAVGTNHYWTPTRWKTHQDGNTISLWTLDTQQPSQVFFVNSNGNLCCNGAEVDVMGNAITMTHNDKRQRTEPWPNPWSHPLPTFSYSNVSKKITVKFHADPVISNNWPRAQSEWKDKEFTIVARSAMGTKIPSFQAIARWAPSSANSTIQWADADAVGYERPAYRWDNLGVEESGTNMVVSQNLDSLKWEIEGL